MARKKLSKEIVAHNEKLPYIKAKHPDQQLFIDDLKDDSLPICINNSLAGSGKTYISIGLGLLGLKSGKYNRLIISRPMVETGKSMGFLPGLLEEKIDPYLQPMFDEMRNFITSDDIKQFILNGKNRNGSQELIICPLNFMRGRNFHDSYMILDEASSCTREELLLFVTRIGNNSKAVIIGDTAQSDLFTNDYYFNKRKFDKQYEEKQAFEWFMDKIDGCEGVSITEFGIECVVRNPIIGKVLKHMNLEK